MTRVPVEPDLVEGHLARIAELVESCRWLDLPTAPLYEQLRENLARLARNVEILKALHRRGKAS